MAYEVVRLAEPRRNERSSSHSPADGSEIPHLSVVRPPARPFVYGIKASKSPDPFLPPKATLPAASHLCPSPLFPVSFKEHESIQRINTNRRRKNKNGGNERRSKKRKQRKKEETPSPRTDEEEEGEKGEPKPTASRPTMRP